MPQGRPASLAGCGYQGSSLWPPTLCQSHQQHSISQYKKEGVLPSTNKLPGADAMTTDVIQFNLRSISLVLIAIAVISLPAFAQTQDDKTQNDKTLSPYFVVKGDP